MFAQDWSRKRERENDEDIKVSGFSEHRTKRRIANLPHRTSPKFIRNTFSTSAFGFTTTSYPTNQQQIPPPTITPVDSDEDSINTPAATEHKSFFSPSYSSPPSHAIIPSSPIPDAIDSSQSTQMSDIGAYSDDCEMSDNIHLSPGSFHNELPACTIAGRIPTPIHSSFAPYVRHEKAARHFNPDFADDEAMSYQFPRNKRLPSPISEGEMSPSVIVEGLEDMQMEVEQEPERTPTKKGHKRSPHASTHSLRSWSGFGGGTGATTPSKSDTTGMKRSFSMGYRADCEKCRNRVPNHHSHIIYE